MKWQKGPANKVFIPSNAVETLGSLGALGELFKEKGEVRMREPENYGFFFCFTVGKYKFSAGRQFDVVGNFRNTV
ncbi:hypothetical protein GCM10020331_065990 [Ectobacillus funiculus]